MHVQPKVIILVQCVLPLCETRQLVVWQILDEPFQGFAGFTHCKVAAEGLI